MVTKEYLRDFADMLGKPGNTPELEARERVLLDVLREHYTRNLSRELIADLRFLLRQLQAELMARREAAAVSRFRQQA